MNKINAKLNQINSIERDLRVKKESSNQLELQYKKGIEKMDNHFHFISSRMDKYESTLQHTVNNMAAQTKKHLDSKKEHATRQIDTLMSSLHTRIAIFTSDLDKLTDIIRSHSMHLTQLDDELLPAAHSLKHVTLQMKRLYKTYQNKTSILDGTINTLHEELDNIQINTEKVFQKQTEEILQNLHHFLNKQNVPSRPIQYHSSTTPVNQHPTSTYHTPNDRPQYQPSNTSHQQFRHRTETQYKGIKTDIIRKMAKLSCTDSDQLLDFYTKLRTAMMQAGIFFREIHEIQEDDPIYEEKDGYSDEDYRTQSNALCSFLCNKDAIPQDFTFAQNSLKSMTSTMDGFQSLKSMLVLVHPSLNNRRPPNNPPVYSETEDLHLY